MMKFLVAAAVSLSIAFAGAKPTAVRPTKSNPIGYKQVNTVLSEAYNRIISNGQYKNIVLYNAGLPFGDLNLQSLTLSDPADCPVFWDRQEVPVGILADAIASGTFKWCANARDFGSVQDGLIGNATRADFLQNIKVGDYYGTEVDQFNALTIQMSLILERPLKPKIVFVPAVNDFVTDLVNAMARDLCYASSDTVLRHPWREAVADFACVTLRFPQGVGIAALTAKNIDLNAALASSGLGISICTSSGSTQEQVALRDFPQATIKYVIGGSGVFVKEMCKGTCDAVVGYGLTILPTDGCPVNATLNQLKLAPPSSGGGDAGAITYRP